MLAHERPRARVLCVDDEPLVLEGLEGILRRRFDVSLATSGALALAMIARGPHFDVVVSDFQMPEMNGADFLARVRERSGHSVRILLTGQASLSGAIAAVNQGGIASFLTKPCPPEVLVRAVEEAAASAQLARSDHASLERELASVGRLLTHADRLATLGTMVSTVGHELNNVLNGFQAALGFVRESQAQGLPAGADDLELLEAVGGHLREQARHILHLGKPGAAPPGTTCDLHEVLAEVVAMLRAAGALNLVLVQVDLPARTLPVRLERARAEQIFVNLVKNAADACGEATGRPRRLRVLASADDARGRLECRVEDNGVGIPEAHLDTIFEPYFTTKPSDKGTGLGLFVVRRILTEVGGTIEVHSEVGVGTTFVVGLPLAQESATDRPPAP